MTWAIWQPVTNANDAVDGRPSGSSSQRAGGLLEDRGGRSDGVEPGVLVPRGGQPVGRDGGRQGAADHEAEVARGAGGHKPAVDGGEQLVEDRRRAERPVGQALGEAVGEGRSFAAVMAGRPTGRVPTEPR